MSMYDIRNSAESSDTLDIYIYSDIDSCWWNPDAMSANKFRKELEAHKDAKQINLYVNSMGGSVAEGVTIFNQIRRHSAKVTAYIDGFACSIASVIPMAADEVVMGENAMLMIHNPWTFAMGNSKDLRKAADDLDKVREGCILTAYKSKCGDKLTDEKLTEMLDEETFLTAAECLEYGFADRILSISNDEKKADAEDKVKEAMDHAKASFMDNFTERFGKMVAKAKSSEAVKMAAETAENAAEKQQEYKYLDAENTKVIRSEDAADIKPELKFSDKTDVPDNNVGNFENESEPDKEDKTLEPAEDTKAKTNELFMKLIKGEM